MAPETVKVETITAIAKIAKQHGVLTVVVGGAIMVSKDDLYSKLKFNQNALGGGPSPFDCFLVLRGSKTLAVRMERHSQNAQKIAEYLSAHPRVEAVIYPGLKTHPQHALAKRQMTGFGGMITFTLKGSKAKTADFLRNLKVIALAESLGGVESLINQPAVMTHASLAKEERKWLGVTDNLLRLSVGIEDYDDLAGDLEQALKDI
jgi:cystathionine gamma-lyase